MPGPEFLWRLKRLTILGPFLTTKSRVQNLIEITLKRKNMDPLGHFLIFHPKQHYTFQCLNPRHHFKTMCFL